MILTTIEEQAPIPPPSFQREQARLSRALHLNALTLVTTLHLPSVLTHALTTQQLLSNEEVVFDTARGRVTCLCTLKPFIIPPGDRTPEYKGEIATGRDTFNIESETTDGFIMLLRSIERAYKLALRILGTHARLTFDNVVGGSNRLQEAIRLARLASGTNSTVLLHGETGTGKEIFAQSIHNYSARADGPFVAINCAAIPRELITTELFGYEGGAFTGADRQGRSGKFEQAHRGTLFLDEIGDMPLDLQASLLRAIETRSIVRIGGQRIIPADVRVIAATHKDLREEVRHSMDRTPTLSQKFTAELLGTAFLVFVGPGSITASNLLLHGTKGVFSLADLGAIALAFAFAIAAMVYTIGHISGCHINPAVTIAFATTRRISWSEAGMYIVAQLIGGLVGALMIALAYSGTPSAAATLGYGATDFSQASTGYIVAIAMEVIGTFFLLFVIMGTAVDGRAPAGWAGLIIGLAVAGEILVFGPITNVLLNPSRSIGP